MLNKMSRGRSARVVVIVVVWRLGCLAESMILVAGLVSFILWDAVRSSQSRLFVLVALTCHRCATTEDLK